MRKALLRAAIVLILLSFGLGMLGGAVFAAEQDTTLKTVAKRGKLVVGMEPKYRPFEYVDEKGTIVGFDVDLAAELARTLGVELVLRDMEFTALIPALHNGQVDLVISGLTGTLERAKTVTFSDPYFETGLCVLASRTRAPGLTHVDQLDAEGRAIAVKSGTTADLVLTKRFAKAVIHRFKDESAAVNEVVAGRADAFIYDQISVARHAAAFSQAAYALLTPFTFEPFCIAMRKGDFDTWQYVNMFLRQAARDGTVDRLKKTHLGQLSDK